MRPASSAELRIATYEARLVEAGEEFDWSDGELTVPRELTHLAEREPALDAVGIELVRPGTAVRINNVLDAIQPAAKSADPSSTFPGALGELTAAGAGSTNVLEGVATLSAADLRGVPGAGVEDLPESIIDMEGPGAALTPWSRTTNLVLTYSPAPTASLDEVDAAIRRCSLQIARDAAAATIGHVPSRERVFRMNEPDPTLPTFCVILQVASEGPGVDTYLYGAPIEAIVPTLLDPREVLDGALVNAAYDHAGVRNPTAFYQGNRLITQLLEGDGRRWNFAGVILTLGYLNSAFAKRRMAVMSAKLAAQLRADGAILTTFSSGNSHTDTMLTCRACELAGVKTTVIVAETNGGLTDHVAEADSIVSVGNEDELVSEWRPDRVIGGDAFPDGRRAGNSGPVPTRAYLGSTSQMGDLALTGAPE